jgi:8-oxo-dGTP diphosphatase
VRVLLVRHARAGSRAGWIGDDGVRPLTPRGWMEAAALVALLAPYRPARILSSPLTRCLQTVSPLAQALGLHVEEVEALGPMSDGVAEAYVRTAASSPDDSVVMCSHREVISRLQRRLGRKSGTAFDKRSICDKASTWVLDFVDGSLAGAAYLPSPRVGTDHRDPESSP